MSSYTDSEGNEWTDERHADFARQAESNGFKVRWYSGRGMYGKGCPAISGDDLESLFRATTVKGLSWDQLGLGYIVYCK